MKKRILAIFLCLILTVSLAAAVAAEDLTVTLPPNILPPNMPNQPEIEPDDTPVPDDTTITLQIPIGKVVTLGVIPRRSGRRLPLTPRPATNVMAAAATPASGRCGTAR